MSRYWGRGVAIGWPSFLPRESLPAAISLDRGADHTHSPRSREEGCVQPGC